MNLCHPRVNSQNPADDTKNINGTVLSTLNFHHIFKQISTHDLQIELRCINGKYTCLLDQTFCLYSGRISGKNVNNRLSVLSFCAVLFPTRYLG